MKISPHREITGPTYKRLSWAASCLFAALVFVILSAGVSVAGDPATSAGIIEMLQADVSEEIIMVKIDVDGCQCDTSAEAIIEFKSAGASDELVVAIIYAAKDN